MTTPDHAPRDADRAAANLAKAKAIQDLLIGPDREAFQTFQNRVSRFCPFEAIGMVHQEIRHAHFLSFLLDPNRPHPFQDEFLKLFLQQVVAEARDGQAVMQPLEVHCFDFNGAQVYRERADIDIFIEVPPAPGAKGLVIAVELKVHASESGHQLNKYRNWVLGEYPPDDWDHQFAFLTLDAAPPSAANEAHWIPVSLLQLLDTWDHAVALNGYACDATDLYRKYALMIRRHLMKDEELATLAKKIWAKHREALDALFEHKPDLLAEVFDRLEHSDEALSEAIERESGFRITRDTSSNRLLRYSVDRWLSRPGFCGEERGWVSTGSLLMIELTNWGHNTLRVSLVMGPGEQGHRDAVYRAVLEEVDRGRIKIGRRTSSIGAFKHLSAAYVLRNTDYERAMLDEESPDEIKARVVRELAKFLKKTLPVYDEIVTRVFGEAPAS